MDESLNGRSVLFVIRKPRFLSFDKPYLYVFLKVSKNNYSTLDNRRVFFTPYKLFVEELSSETRDILQKRTVKEDTIIEYDFTTLIKKSIRIHLV